VVLEETNDNPIDVGTTFETVPASEIDCDGGYNLKTGIKFLRVAISLGTGLDLNYVLKRIRTDGSITK